MSALSIPTVHDAVSFVRLLDRLHDKYEFAEGKPSVRKAGQEIEYKTGEYFTYLEEHILYIHIKFMKLHIQELQKVFALLKVCQCIKNKISKQVSATNKRCQCFSQNKRVYYNV